MTGQWFSPSTPISSTNKTVHHDIAEILLKVALNTINQINIQDLTKVYTIEQWILYSGVILPGETMKFPFVFKSPNAGVFTEQWRFETRPVLCGGASLIVTLRGIALQEDKFQKEREQLEVFI